jgi:peptidoglycan/LPS O-acetylase OafA/YrhL
MNTNQIARKIHPLDSVKTGIATASAVSNTEPAHASTAYSPTSVMHTSSEKNKPRLESLTSLRFFAASMILLLHLSQLFQFNNHSALQGLALWQGVSFFFVLSGFILAYVHPRIETAEQSNRFMLARFARIWPTHFVAFLFTIALVPTVLHIPNLIPVAAANLCMVQVWTFNPAVSESFNSVSWTISIELFFYFCFPFLIQDFDRKIKARWLVATILSLSFIALCMAPLVAGYPQGTLPPSLYLGENPICRLFEFNLGIFVCWLFKRKIQLRDLSTTVATILEITAIVAIALAVDLSNLWPSQYATGAISVVRAWAIDMGGAPAYAALILLVATEKGKIAQFLNKKLLVRLGEISFSMYMFHLSVLYALTKYQSSFANLPGWILPTSGTILCLIISHLNFTFIETPLRRKIMGFGAASKSSKSLVSTNKVFVLAEILILACVVVWLNVQFRFVPQSIAQRIEAHGIPNAKDIVFGDLLKMRGLKVSKKPEGIYLDIIWESLRNMKLDSLNAVEIIDPKCKTLSCQTYPQDAFGRTIKAGEIWQDKVFVPTEALKGGLRLGVSVHEAKTGLALKAVGGLSDGGSSRLLVAIP